VSIFVNPTQFGPTEDFSRYPRPITQDIDLCRDAEVDLLFLPKNFYEPDHSSWVDESALSTTLCGASRPGHFRGVCTVVAKLFHVFSPDIAVFGKKDAQQFAVLRRMVRDLDFPVRLVGAETFRERDGLAMSSRNRYLSEEERAQAPVLRWALKAAKNARGTPAERKEFVTQIIQTAPLAEIDYVEAVDAETLAKPTKYTRRILLAVAVRFGKTRLIDNIEIPLIK